MKKILITSLFLLVSISFCCFLGCSNKKYEEGPTISIWPAKDRVVGKWKWAIARETLNGNIINRSLRFKGDTLTFKDDDTFSDSRYQLEGSWAFVSKKNEINLLLGDKSDSLRLPASIAFDIRLLKRKEMWLEFVDDSTKIEWQLLSLDFD